MSSDGLCSCVSYTVCQVLVILNFLDHRPCVDLVLVSLALLSSVGLCYSVTYALCQVLVCYLKSFRLCVMCWAEFLCL